MAVLEAGVTVVLKPISIRMICAAVKSMAAGTSLLSSLSGREESIEQRESLSEQVRVAMSESARWG